MSDRVSYYFRQRVSEDELNLGFELLERAERNLAADIGVYGIVSGAEPAPHEPVPNTSIDLTAPTRAYDRLGQRIFIGAAQNVSCARDTAGVSTDVLGAGNERWLAVFIRFERRLYDERTDGNNQRIYFRQDESFSIRVRQGIEAAAGAAIRVPLEDDELLVCDVRRVFGVEQILREHIDVSRRQALVFARAESVGIDAELWRTLRPTSPNVQAALDDVDTRLGRHLAGEADQHPARDIALSPSGFVTSRNVQDGVAEIAQKLASAANGSAGSGLIGADQVAGLPRALPTGSVDSQLALLLEFLNTHLSATTGAHAASAIRATAHHWLTSESVQAQLQELVAGLRATRVPIEAYRNLETTNVQAQLHELVDDLRSRDAAMGTALLGGAELTGSPRSVPANSLLGQLRGIVNQLNAHAGSSDHDSRYVRRVFAGNATIQPNVTVTVATIDAFPDFVQWAYDVGADDVRERVRWFNGPLTPNIRVWLEKTDDFRTQIRAQNRNSAAVLLQVWAYMGG